MGLYVRPPPHIRTGVQVGDHEPSHRKRCSAPSGITRGTAGLVHQALGGGFAVTGEAGSFQALAIKDPLGKLACDADELGQTRGEE